MIEAAAEANDQLMENFFDTGELSEEEIRAGLRQRTLAGEIVVTMCGSAFKNKGVQAMLDAIIDYMPSPVDVPAIKGMREDEVEGEASVSAPLDDETKETPSRTPSKTPSHWQKALKTICVIPTFWIFLICRIKPIRKAS